MKKLLSILLILIAFLVMPGCGDDGPGSTSCENATVDVLSALSTFQGNTNANTCQALINALDDALNSCQGQVTQDQIDDWNDLVASDPCDGL